MKTTTQVARDVAFTANTLGRVACDALTLRTGYQFSRKPGRFAFLVHPRTAKLSQTGVYGDSDVFKAIPAFKYLRHILPKQYAERTTLRFLRRLPPSTIGYISARGDGYDVSGRLLTTPRPLDILFKNPEETRPHLEELFRLAALQGNDRVGLGGLLPSLTRGGRLFAGMELASRPAVSTGHAYTAYVISEYLLHLVSHRNRDGAAPEVAVVGAGGSTGKAIVRTFTRAWPSRDMSPINLLLVDTREDRLTEIAQEISACPAFNRVRTSDNLASIRNCEYVIVVTNAQNAIIKPEHVRPGMVIIDDSQPRNTGPELEKAGCFVLDVLARINGLDCRFNFGFKTLDRTVTFTCLAETVLAAIAGCSDDLAVGEVTYDVIERMLEIVEVGKHLGAIGAMPFFTFGREMSPSLKERLHQPAKGRALAAAE